MNLLIHLMSLQAPAISRHTMLTVPLVIASVIFYKKLDVCAKLSRISNWTKKGVMEGSAKKGRLVLRSSQKNAMYGSVFCS